MTATDGYTGIPANRRDARGSTRATVEALARAILDSLPGFRTGDLVTLELVCRECDVTRHMAREALAVLHQKRLVELHPRAGGRVRPEAEWALFDPDVIQWRLRAFPRFQLLALSELREAVEPRAAYLAASRATAEECRELVRLGRQLRDHARDPAFGTEGGAGLAARRRFQDVDAAFHAVLLGASHNEMFAQLADPFGRALQHRIESDLQPVTAPPDEAGVRGAVPGLKQFPRPPAPVAMWLHHGVAHAVQAGHPEAAETFARALLAEIRTVPLPLTLCDAVWRATGAVQGIPLGERFTRQMHALVTAGREQQTYTGEDLERELDATGDRPS